MSDTRYETRIQDGTFYIESDDGWLEIGPVDGIVDLLGGEAYTLEYTRQQASAAWLNTDNDNTITISVRETLGSMSYQIDFVANLANCPLDERGTIGYPKRTELYAELMTEILESKGNLRN